MNWKQSLGAIGILAACGSFLTAAPKDDLFVDEDKQQSGPSDSDLFPDGPPPAESPLNKALAAFREGDREESEKIVRAAIGANPSLPPAELILAEFHLDLGQRQAAKMLLESVSEAHENNAQLYLTYGKLAISENRLTEAKMHFKKMEQIGPRADWGAAEKAGFRSAVLSGLATVNQRRGNWEAALSQLTELARLQPKDVSLRQRLAKALALTDREAESLVQLKAVYQADPTATHPHAALGGILVQAGKYERANEHFQTALRQSPKDGAVLYAWSVALLYQDQLSSADEFARKAADEGLQTTNLQIHRGRISWASGKHDEAERYFRDALKQSPNNSAATYYLILSLASQKDTSKRSEAESLAEKNAAENPRSVSAAAAKGMTLFALGKQAEAEATMAPIADHPSFPTEAQLIYGRVLAANGKGAQARQVASRLKRELDQPGIVLVRSAADRWIDQVLATP